MAYTHCFTQKEAPTQEEWAKIASDFAKLSKSLPIRYENDIDEPPQITAYRIRFNGIGDDGHETMMLVRDDTGFQFCKTARKPYDTAVTALLILAHYHAPGCWEIGSDGDDGDWAEGLALVQRLRPDAQLPAL